MRLGGILSGGCAHIFWSGGAGLFLEIGSVDQMGFTHPKGPFIWMMTNKKSAVQPQHCIAKHVICGCYA